MKKIIFFIMTVLMLSACCGCNETPSEVIQGNTSRVIIKPTDSYSRSYHVIDFTYNGHNYIMFLGTETMSVVHDPNCSCMDNVETIETIETLF